MVWSDQDSWGWAPGQPGVLAKGEGGPGLGCGLAGTRHPALALQNPSHQTGQTTGCGVDQGRCLPCFALEPMELRPDASHKENVPPRPAVPLRPGKTFNGSGLGVAGAAIGPQLPSLQASPMPP